MTGSRAHRRPRKRLQEPVQMIRRVFSSLPWVLLAQVRGQCPSWSDEGLVELCGKPCIEWCWGKNNDEAACVKSFVLLGSGAAWHALSYARSYSHFA